jgi:hypothetical protein
MSEKSNPPSGNDEAEVQQRANEVDRLLTRKDKVNALLKSLENTSIATKSDEAKVRFLNFPCFSYLIA